ncbi:MAG: hypothetical protein Q7J45_00735 [bacterium]|nr:hypothetical protein [bacterium]
MTLEELQALVAELTTSVDSLKAKNATLITEKRALQAKAKGADIDPEEHAALLSQVDTLTEQLKTVTKAKDTESGGLKKSLAEKDSALEKLLVDNGINEALIKAGVAPQFHDMAKSHFRSQAQIKSENGAFVAVIGDKPMSEGIAAYLAGDSGKHLISAPASSGGGASGSGNKGPGGVTKVSDLKSTAEKVAYIAEHGDKAFDALPK